MRELPFKALVSPHHRHAGLVPASTAQKNDTLSVRRGGPRNKSGVTVIFAWDRQRKW